MAIATVSDGLWELLQPLLPITPRRVRSPGRRRLDDRQVLNGILYVLATGIAWDQLPQQLGFGSGMTCWRRLRDWNQAGVWTQLHQLLLAELRRADQLDWSRAVIDAAHLRALKGGRRPGQVRSIGHERAASTTSSAMPGASRWRSA
jgi:transposase